MDPAVVEKWAKRVAKELDGQELTFNGVRALVLTHGLDDPLTRAVTARVMAGAKEEEEDNPPPPLSLREDTKTGTPSEEEPWTPGPPPQPCHYKTNDHYRAYLCGVVTRWLRDEPQLVPHLALVRAIKYCGWPASALHEHLGGGFYSGPWAIARRRLAENKPEQKTLTEAAAPKPKPTPKPMTHPVEFSVDAKPWCPQSDEQAIEFAWTELTIRAVLPEEDALLLQRIIFNVLYPQEKK